jgi:diguanylate cyclase (GGDEF)-like protein/PAS domain S-box-containing protein
VKFDGRTFEDLFETSNDPQYIMTMDGETYLKVNPAFESLTGYAREDLMSGRVKPQELVMPEDWEMVLGKRKDRIRKPADRYELRVKCRDGSIKHVEASVKMITVSGEHVVLGSARDITSRKRLEERLKEEIGIQKRKTLEAAKASVRIFQLTEKIRNVPRMTAALLDATSQKELLSRAADLLVDPEGLSYAKSVFLLSDGDHLLIRESRPHARRASYPLSGRSRYAIVARKGTPFRGNKGEFIVPLRSRGEIVGVMEVCFDRNEKVLFDDSESVRSGQEDIVLTLSNSVGMMIENLRLYEKIRQQSIVDQLTQTFNRRHFDRKLAEEVRRAQRYTRRLSLLMIDADYFKDINDSWGHPVGDVILTGLANMFKKTSRDLDIVCRWGGDEFAILLPETDGKAGTKRAERLRVLVEELVHANPEDPQTPLTITISIGISDVVGQEMTPGDLVRAADDALYRSKREGRNRVTYVRAHSADPSDTPAVPAAPPSRSAR